MLIDKALPDEELDRIERVIAVSRLPEIAGYHKLRARRPAPVATSDLHVQFRAGTSLEEAHRHAHDLRDAIEREFRDADVLIHVEPEGLLPGRRGGGQPLRHG